MTKSEALKKRWEMIPDDVRKRMASRAATARWLKATKEERSNHSKMMNDIKYKKNVL